MELPGLTSVMPEMLAGAEAVVVVEVAEAVEGVELVVDAADVEVKAFYHLSFSKWILHIETQLESRQNSF